VNVSTCVADAASAPPITAPATLVPIARHSVLKPLAEAVSAGGTASMRINGIAA
jgi:hypothetical protein